MHSSTPVYDALAALGSALPALNPPPHLQRWVPGLTPLSTPAVVYPTIAAYLAIIFLGRYLMRDRAPFVLRAPFQTHNFVLFNGSGLLLLLMLEEAVPMVLQRGFFASICHADSWTPRLEFFYIINYYFKYLELVDTVFLVLKKKPLAFLHVYHHAATALLCYNQLNGRTSVSWVVIVLNLAVHVVMYYYYYATAGGARISWKKLLTSMQISQFVIDLFIVYFGMTLQILHTFKPGMVSLGGCAGDLSSGIFGCALLTSYLFLFIAFYRQAYNKRGNVGKIDKLAGATITPNKGVQLPREQGHHANKVNPETGL